MTIHHRTKRKLFHPEHFQCQHCKLPIAATEEHYMKPDELEPYHVRCYEERVLVRCFSCNLLIKEGEILEIALVGDDNQNVTFHSKCFKCGQMLTKPPPDTSISNKGCNALLEVARDGALSVQYCIFEECGYCALCARKLQLPSCFNCHQIIDSSKTDDSTTSFLYNTHEGNPYCQPCYDKQYVMTCERCQKPIRSSKVDKVGNAISVNGRHFHSDCFNCFECGQPFPELKAHTFEQNFYCRDDFLKKSKFSKS